MQFGMNVHGVPPEIQVKRTALAQLCNEQETKADQERGVEEIANAFSEIEGMGNPWMQIITSTMRMQ